MVQPQMDPDPTKLERTSGGQPISTGMCVAEAVAHLRLTGETAAVVYRNGRPVGVVTADALARARNERNPDAPIIKVMDYVAVPVASAV